MKRELLQSHKLEHPFGCKNYSLVGSLHPIKRTTPERVSQLNSKAVGKGCKNTKNDNNKN